MNAIRAVAQTGLRAALLFRVLTMAKSFEGNSPIGSKTLNRLGLHRWRVKTAANLASWRRSRLAKHVPAHYREQFLQNGFIIIRNVLPEDEFAQLKQSLSSRAWPAREMTQGDTITRRTAINQDVLQESAPLRQFLGQKWLKSLFRYVASYDKEPLLYIQSISKKPAREADPQTAMHSDTFHPSMKAWYFLNEVKAGEGAFTYVRGSHRLTPERLAWEHAKAQTLPEQGDKMSRRGSFRIEPEELASIGLPEPEELACPANTLVIADTYGFHGRGPSGPELNRVEIWAYCRRNPFLPYLGADFFSLPMFRSRRMDWLWSVRDRFPKAFRQPWRKVGNKKLPIVASSAPQS